MAALHSQIVRTAQPAFRSALSFRRSRATLSLNFFVQNSTRVLGVVAFAQLLCRCQKQPLTKTTVRYFGRTMSGVPGRSLRCKRKRRPRACSICRTAISAPVSERLTARMTSLRTGSTDDSGFGGRRKIIDCLENVPELVKLNMLFKIVCVCLLCIRQQLIVENYPCIYRR